MDIRILRYNHNSAWMLSAGPLNTNATSYHSINFNWIHKDLPLFAVFFDKSICSSLCKSSNGTCAEDKVASKLRSEERRVGKVCRYRCGLSDLHNNTTTSATV